MIDERRTMAKELLRARLEESRREGEREQARAEGMRTLLRAGKISGLGAPELAEAAGLSRAGVYENLQRDARGSGKELDEVILALIAAGGATPRAALPGMLGVKESLIAEAVERLAGWSAINFAAAGYEVATSQEILTLTPEGETALAERLQRALGRAPERWSAYIALDPAEALQITDAAERRFGPNRSALLPAGTMASMQSPELALTFDVSDQVELFNEAATAWHSLRTELLLSPAPMQITAFSPPRSRSATLEAVARGIAEAEPAIGRQAKRVVANVEPKGQELTICVRALTEAAQAMRRSVGQERRPPEISNGELAFDELQAVAGLRPDAPREKIQKALTRALERATDRLGPLPAGRLGSFRAPGEDAHVVEGVSPTASDLLEIARASGEALGHAHASSGGEIDAVEALSRSAGLSPS
jgi:hypothetical protein